MKILFPLVLLAGLAACSSVPANVVAPIVKGALSAVPGAGNVLSATTAAACATQAAANGLGAIATAQGNAKNAQIASNASAVAGVLCAW